MDILDSIVNNIDESLIVTDGSGKIIFFNNNATVLCQNLLKKDLQQGDDLFQLINEAGKPEAKEIIQAIQLHKKPDRTFDKYVGRQGAIFYLETSYVPVVNDQDELNYIHIFVRDITPQKTFERKLATQTANISNLIEKANAIIIGTDAQGYITDWNEYCTKITGYEKDEVYAQRFDDILLPNESIYFDQLLNKVLVNESVRNYEIQVRTKSGTNAILLLNGTHRTTASGEITGIHFVGQDVTELTEYRKSLEKKVAERTREWQQALAKEKEVVELKSRFISIASHEFRSPLSSIELGVDFLMKYHARIEPERFREKVNMIKKQIKHMTFLLDDVLTYGKSEAGKIQVNSSTLNLIDFIQRIVEEVGHSTANTHTIKRVLENIPEKIESDEKLLRNIFINLLTNAIKFSPGKTAVYLNVFSEDDQLAITVRDTGMGIPKEDMSKVFEAFVRGKGTDTIEGTGLGLSIVKKAVELLQGNITVESDENVGTVFTIILPMVKTEETNREVSDQQSMNT